MNSRQEFEWDVFKAQANLRKHKVPFLKACAVFKDFSRIERFDASGNRDEERWNAIGCVDDTVLFGFGEPPALPGWQ